MTVKTGFGMCICNPNTRETEAKESVLIGYHELHSEILSLKKGEHIISAFTSLNFTVD